MAEESFPTDPAVESAIVEFIDLFNARDWEAVGELFHSDASSEYFDATSRSELLEAFSELDDNYPGLLLTRAEVGTEPVAVAWLPDYEARSWSPVGYLSFSATDGDEPLLDHVDYVEAADGDDQLLAEEPEPEDLPEWFDWNAYEEGAPSID